MESAYGLDVVSVVINEEDDGLSIVGVALVSSLTVKYFKAAGSLASPLVKQCIRPPTGYVSSSEIADQFVLLAVQACTGCATYRC